MDRLEVIGGKIGYKSSIIYLLVLEAVILVLLGCCTYSRVGTLSDENKQYMKSLRDSTRLKSEGFAVKMEKLRAHPSDSLHDKEELARLIVEIDAEYNRRLDNVLADLRQESNNQLSWLNSWLTVWLGALSFIGVVLPLLITYMVRYDNREQQKQFEQKYKDAFDTTKREIAEKISGSKDELSKYYSSLHGFNEISAVISCVTVLKELSRHYFTPEQKEQWIILFRLLLEKNRAYITTLANAQGEDSRQYDHSKYFLIYLLQIQALLKTLEPFYLYPSSHKVLSEARAWGKGVFKEIPHLSPHDVQAKLEELQHILCKLIEITRSELDR